jgi:hypothetical protein
VPDGVGVGAVVTLAAVLVDVVRGVLVDVVRGVLVVALVELELVGLVEEVVEGTLAVAGMLACAVDEVLVAGEELPPQAPAERASTTQGTAVFHRRSVTPLKPYLPRPIICDRPAAIDRDTSSIGW